ncbi:hypothetical protein [Geminicoccus harenae]|uniref:hypothetical protein n=1 Tax=Geminicoccus harenae TaxID=2498453 RepID=UPI00168B6CFD|nr:hypothetical protein [Geminicoccus harenae]
MNVEKRLLTLPEFYRPRSVRKTFTYGEIAAGRLKVVKVGRATRIPVEAAEAWDDLVLKGEVGPKRDKAA